MKRIFLLLPLICTVWIAAAQQHAAAVEPPEEPSVFNWLTIVTALLAIAALVLSFLVYRNLARLLNSVGRRKIDIKILQDELAEIKSRVVQQNTVVKDTTGAGDTKALEARLALLEKRIIKFEAQSPAIETKAPPASKSSKQTAVVAQKKYAKLPDLQNGFSNEVLQDRQNGEQIYELDITGEKAVFAISQDAAVQKYALSDFQYYLSNGCTLTNQPVKDSRIVMSEPGILSKSDNGWKIEKKAVITFN